MLSNYALERSVTAFSELACWTTLVGTQRALHLLRTICQVLICAFAAACTITHPVSDGFPKYLAKNPYELKPAASAVPMEYRVSQRTLDYTHEFRAWTVGQANLWVVQPGQILLASLESKNVQDAFGGGLPRVQVASPDALCLNFELNKYEFIDYRAKLDLTVEASVNGSIRLSRRFQIEGQPQTTQMWLTGVAGMNLAIEQSTQDAFQQIFDALLSDLNAMKAVPVGKSGAVVN